MKHRATARRRFFLAEFADDAPPPGTPIISEGREVATLATGANGRALALVRLDRLAEAEAKHATITADGRDVQLKKPEWLHA
jgi:folate-binding Fe-S cluster repair protein YgfZ